ncbi:MAG: flagellin [Bermanella sp.]
MQVSNGFSARALDRAQASQQTQAQNLSSGKRINSAQDDAAGLVISTGLDTQHRAQGAALRNSLDGVSRLQVEDAALSSVAEDLQRIRELTLQQQNGIFNEGDSQALQAEIDQRLESIEQVFKHSDFNGRSLFESAQGNIQSGANPGQSIAISHQDLAAQFSAMGVSAGEDLELDALDEALQEVSSRRSELGALESRLQGNAEFLALRSESNQSANSRIRDTDLAQSVSLKTKADVQFKVAVAVQGQANANQQDVLRLLKP